MLLVSSPSNFFALRRLVILLQKRRFGKKIRKTSKAMQATFTIKVYTIPFRLSIIFKEFMPIFQSSPKPQKKLSRSRAENQLTTTSGTNISSVSDV